MSRPTKQIQKVAVNLSFNPQSKEIISKYFNDTTGEGMSAAAERLLLAEASKHEAIDLGKIRLALKAKLNAPANKK